MDCALVLEPHVVSHTWYPAHWWRGAPRSFYYKAGLERAVAFKQLREWAVDGKEWRKCRPSA